MYYVRIYGTPSYVPLALGEMATSNISMKIFY